MIACGLRVCRLFVGLRQDTQNFAAEIVPHLALQHALTLHMLSPFFVHVLMLRGPDRSGQETSSLYQTFLLSTRSAMPSVNELDNSNWNIDLIGEILKEHLIR